MCAHVSSMAVCVSTGFCVNWMLAKLLPVQPLWLPALCVQCGYVVLQSSQVERVHIPDMFLQKKFIWAERHLNSWGVYDLFIPGKAGACFFVNYLQMLLQMLPYGKAL